MKKVLVVTTTLLLAACASAPKDPSAKALGVWQEIGKIHNNNMILAYDTGSLKVQGNTISLRERKIVQKTEQENYLNLPEFKTAVSEWEFDCVKRTYRIKNAEYWDKNGKNIAQQQYSANQVPAMAIVNNTPTEKLFQIACKK